MKKISFSLFLLSGIVFVFFLGTVSSFAADLPTNPSGFSVSTTQSAVSTLQNESIFTILSVFLNWILGLLGILSVIGFVVSGIFYITSVGDEDQAKKAKTIMMYTIIGLTIALLGLIIVNAIAGLTGAGEKNFFGDPTTIY